MKDFAKSIRTMNSNKEEIIKKKKQEGATLKVDNGQKLEFSDGSTFVKTSFSEDYREAKNYTGNKKVKNGSGHWGRGGADVYKDNSNPGISASIRQVGKGFEVLYTDTYKKISGKSVGIYPDKDTAKDVAEAVVETEMPDSVKANYRSKAVNAWLRRKWEVGNKNVKNGSGSWRGKFYEDSAGNSASIEKRGEGWEVYWEDARGYGKPLGTYKDERTAREVAEDAVESEMPDNVKSSYRSKAVNARIGNRVGSLFTEEERANIALGRYEEAKKRGYGVDYEKKLAKDEIQTLEKIAKGEAKYMGFEEKDIPDAKKAIEIYKKIVSNKKTLNIATGNESIDKQEWSMFSGLKKDAEKEIGNSDTVSEYNAEIQRLTKKAEQLRRMGQGRSAMEIEKQIEKLGKELRELGNKKTTNDFLSDHIKIVGIPDPDTSKEPVDNLKRARNAMNKKIGNLDTVEEGDYVTVRFQGELVDGVVRKVQGTQALVTIDGTDMWFPIRSLKEST